MFKSDEPSPLRDITPRIFPEEVLALSEERPITGRIFMFYPILEIKIHGPREHPMGSVIKPHLFCVEAITQYDQRWFGFNAVWIDPEIEWIVVRGFNPKHKTITKWEIFNR